MWCVYRHVAPNGKMYVGITSQLPNERWGSNGCRYKGCVRLKYAIQKYGWDNIKHEVLLDGLTMEQACLAERLFISYWDLTNPDKGYNIKDGGVLNSTLPEESRRKISKALKGKPLSAETRRKMSESRQGEKHHMYGRKGEANPNYGSKRSEETRRKMSEAQRGEKNHMYGKCGDKHHFYGKHHTEETKAKIRKHFEEHGHPGLGKKRSEATILKIRENRPNKKMVVQINMDSRKIVNIFPSISEATRQTGVNNITACCKGRIKHSGGYIWKYYEKERIGEQYEEN